MNSLCDKTVRHILLCRFHSGITEEQISHFIAQFRGITCKIPGILSFEFGVNSSPENMNRALTHACILTFENSQARDGYLTHPEHLRFVAEDAGILAELLVFDYGVEA